jgi:hypothetical protein
VIVILLLSSIPEEFIALELRVRYLPFQNVVAAVAGKSSQQVRRRWQQAHRPKQKRNEPSKAQ